MEAERGRGAPAATAAPATGAGVSSPAGRWRRAVRGLAASMNRSARRLTAQAHVRAPAIARVTQSRVGPPGQPSAATTPGTDAKGAAHPRWPQLYASTEGPACG